MAKLSREDVVTSANLVKRGFSQREIAAKLGVSEGAVRYQLRRAGGWRPQRARKLKWIGRTSPGC